MYSKEVAQRPIIMTFNVFGTETYELQSATANTSLTASKDSPNCIFVNSNSSTDDKGNNNNDSSSGSNSNNNDKDDDSSSLWTNKWDWTSFAKNMAMPQKGAKRKIATVTKGRNFFLGGLPVRQTASRCRRRRSATNPEASRRRQGRAPKLKSEPSGCVMGEKKRIRKTLEQTHGSSSS